jgi:nitrogen regulatory protein P-II 1
MWQGSAAATTSHHLQHHRCRCPLQTTRKQYDSTEITMKMIVAIIRPEKWDEVRAELSKHDIYLMTISDVRGCGKERGQTEVYRGTEFEEQLIPKLKLEIAVNDNFLEDAIESILVGARSGNTGAIGDGKIFVFPMEDCVRIRTGERGKTAIGP